MAEYAAERQPLEDDGPLAAEGRAWHGAFQALCGPLERHMSTLLEVHPSPCGHMTGHDRACAGMAEMATYEAAQTLVYWNAVNVSLGYDRLGRIFWRVIDS